MAKSDESVKINLKNQSRHAYLILSHKNDLVFQTLIQMLDNPYNDIFIHMDKKQNNFSEEDIKRLARKSNVFFAPRTKVSWGSYSVINAELLLIKEATRHGHYAYYHLLSGQDLPIKTQNYIHNFFDNNLGKEFIRFQSPSFSYEERVRYYYPFQEKLNRKGPLFLRIVNKIAINTRKLLHVHRNRQINFQKGTNWFSITDDLARFIIEKERWIKKTFANSNCCDEIFLQTIVDNSKFRKHLFYSQYDNNPKSIMRLIDWRRGNPYVFKCSDLNEIKKSEYLFVRKIDEETDRKIIFAIKESFA
ncbi:MAG: beta-1,6-N-acetylglucosaminyltransferase [Candidatus Saccharibacteria bacterium]|nr:beta-1,6-N-acetylglucosaminyltransferase [Candidatus Saccharibacteria bacterium]